MKTTIRFGLLLVLALVSLQTLAGDRFRACGLGFTGGSFCVG